MGWDGVDGMVNLPAPPEGHAVVDWGLPHLARSDGLCGWLVGEDGWMITCNA